MRDLRCRRSAIAMLAMVAVVPLLPGPAAASGAGIAGIVWQAVEIAGAPLPEGVGADLLIEADGTAAGRGGCNRYATRATVVGDSISFAPAAATRMMCNAAAMTVERAFFAGLEACRRFSIGPGGGELTLLGADGAVIARFLPGR